MLFGGSMSEKIDGEKPQPEPSSGVVPPAPRVNLEELKQQMLQNLNDPTVAEKVAIREEKLGEEMEKAAARAHQKKESSRVVPPAPSVNLDNDPTVADQVEEKWSAAEIPAVFKGC